MSGPSLPWKYPNWSLQPIPGYGVVQVIITDPDAEVGALELCRHEGEELQGGTQACALLIQELNLKQVIGISTKKRDREREEKGRRI